MLFFFAFIMTAFAGHPSWTEHQYVEPFQPFVMSSTVGFGSGHFNLASQGKANGLNSYEVSPFITQGSFFAGTQLLSGVVAAVGYSAWSNEFAKCSNFQDPCSARNLQNNTVVISAGISSFAILRLIEVITIGKSKQRLNIKIVNKFEEQGYE